MSAAVNSLKRKLDSMTIANDYYEDSLVEQPTVEELTHDLLLTKLISGEVDVEKLDINISTEAI